MRAALASSPVASKAAVSSATDSPTTGTCAFISMTLKPHPRRRRETTRSVRSLATGVELFKGRGNAGERVIVPCQRPACRRARDAHLGASLHGGDQLLFVGRGFHPGAVIHDAAELELVRADLHYGRGHRLVRVASNDRGLVLLFLRRP